MSGSDVGEENYFLCGHTLVLGSLTRLLPIVCKIALFVGLCACAEGGETQVCWLVCGVWCGLQYTLHTTHQYVQYEARN